MRLGVAGMATPTAARTLRADVAPLYLSASGDLGIPEELRARRKPRFALRIVGVVRLLCAVRQSAAPLSQLPPRSTRSMPLAYQSSTHSNRLALRELNVSSRKFTPTPSVPPTACNDRLDKGFRLVRSLIEILWDLPVSLPEFTQHVSRVHIFEQIDRHAKNHLEPSR